MLLESEGGPKEILDDDLYRKNYSKVNLRKLVLILEKYKNDKLNGKCKIKYTHEIAIREITYQPRRIIKAILCGK